MELKRREDKLGGKKYYPRNTFLDWNLEAELYAFGQRLNEEFDSDLLLQAFTDRSYVIKEEMKQKEMDFDLKMKDNKELAEIGKVYSYAVTITQITNMCNGNDLCCFFFLGENFIRAYIQNYLETVLPKFPLEGLKCIRNHLTSESVLANISLHLGTKDIILAAVSITLFMII